jgi:hypothetical protein
MERDWPDSSSVSMFESKYGPPAEYERDTPENPEATIEEAPRERDTAEVASDEGEREDTGTGDQAEGDHPLIADGINVGTNECNGNYKVGKREPVCAVGKERIMGVRSRESFMDAFDPREQMGRFGNRSHQTCAEDGIQPAQFGLERKSCDATDDQASNENGEPETNATKMVSLRHRFE